MGGPDAYAGAGVDSSQDSDDTIQDGGRKTKSRENEREAGRKKQKDVKSEPAACGWLQGGGGNPGVCWRMLAKGKLG